MGTLVKCQYNVSLYTHPKSIFISRSEGQANNRAFSTTNPKGATLDYQAVYHTAPQFVSFGSKKVVTNRTQHPRQYNIHPGMWWKLPLTRTSGVTCLMPEVAA